MDFSMNTNELGTYPHGVVLFGEHGDGFVVAIANNCAGEGETNKATAAIYMSRLQFEVLASAMHLALDAR